MQRHPEDLTSRGLYKIMQDSDSMSLGPRQDLVTWVCTRSCKDRLDDFSTISMRKILTREGFDRSSTKPLCEELFKIVARTSKNKDEHKISSWGRVPGHARTSYRKDFTRISTRSRHKDNRFCEVCAVKTHGDMSQEPFYTRG